MLNPFIQDTLCDMFLFAKNQSDFNNTELNKYLFKAIENNSPSTLFLCLKTLNESKLLDNDLIINLFNLSLYGQKNACASCILINNFDIILENFTSIDPVKTTLMLNLTDNDKLSTNLLINHLIEKNYNFDKFKSAFTNSIDIATNYSTWSIDEESKENLINTIKLTLTQAEVDFLNKYTLEANSNKKKFNL